jgi:hypothetical protein
LDVILRWWQQVYPHFDHLDGTYLFGIAAFDNAQARHAFQTGALKLKFAK